MNTLRAEGLAGHQTGSIGQQCNSFGSLMIIIGSICRQGNSRERRALLKALRKEEADRKMDPQEYHQSPRLPVTEEQQTLSLTRDESGPELGRYTLTLKEHGDRFGNMPLYDIQTLKLSPPSFRATLSVGGKRFQAEGSGKKVAKHKVSKQACEVLQLAVE